MSRRKILVLAVGALAFGVGLAAVLLLGTDPGPRAHEESHPYLVFAAIIPCWSAVFISLSQRKRRRCRRDGGE